MFIVYAVPLGLVAGWMTGGRLAGLESLRFRWAWVALAGLAVQIVLFSGLVDDAVAGVGPALYVGSTAAVLAAVVRNLAIPGLALVALGAVSNLAAILANGGRMPADPGALALAGLDPHTSRFSNSVVDPSPALRPLTDIFALPDALPLANVFSIGDVLIGVGTAATVALAMRRRPRPPTTPSAVAAGAVRPRNSPD